MRLRKRGDMATDAGFTQLPTRHTHPGCGMADVCPATATHKCHPCADKHAASCPRTAKKMKFNDSQLSLVFYTVARDPFGILFYTENAKKNSSHITT